jgi:hypothetical protein
MATSSVPEFISSEPARALWLALPPRKQKAIQSLRQKLDADSRPTLAEWRRLGVFVEALWLEPSQTYGKQRIQALAELIGRPPDSIYRARKFAQLYTAAEARDLEGRLSWVHLIDLLALQHERYRREFQRECLAKGWTSRQLKREIRVRLGRQRSRGQGGRPPRRPTTELEALNQLDEMLTTLLRWFDNLQPASPGTLSSSQKSAKRTAQSAFDLGLTSPELREELTKNMERLRGFQGFVAGTAVGERKRLSTRER